MAVILSTPMIFCPLLEYYVTPIVQRILSTCNTIYCGLPSWILNGYLILDSLLDDFFERWLPMQFVLFLIRVYSEIYIAWLRLNWWLVLIRQLFDPPFHSKLPSTRRIPRSKRSLLAFGYHSLVDFDIFDERLYIHNAYLANADMALFIAITWKTHAAYILHHSNESNHA